MKIELHEVGRTRKDHVVFQVSNDERPDVWKFKATNKVELAVWNMPSWDHETLFLQGATPSMDDSLCSATVDEWERIQAAVAEANEAQKAKPKRIWLNRYANGELGRNWFRTAVDAKGMAASWPEPTTQHEFREMMPDDPDPDEARADRAELEVLGNHTIRDRKEP